MIAQPQPLIEVFAVMPDLRCCRGKRHPLLAMAMASAVALRGRGPVQASLSPDAPLRFQLLPLHPAQDSVERRGTGRMMSTAA
jgi:hypothetical protein